MPVDDTPVHDKVRQPTDFRWGCNNTERTSGYYTVTRGTPSWSGDAVKWEYVPDRSSKDCKYDRKASDPGCRGCGK